MDIPIGLILLTCVVIIGIIAIVMACYGMKLQSDYNKLHDAYQTHLDLKNGAVKTAREIVAEANKYRKNNY